MSKSKLGDLRKLFNELDANGDGVLELKDLRQALKTIGAREEDMRNFIAACDKDGDQKVTFEEFKSLCEG